MQRLVNISSISACSPLPGAELPYRVGAPFTFNSGGLYYALAKYLGEQVGEAYYQAHGLSVIHLRPGVIAGDGHNPGPQAPDNPTEPWFVYVDPRDVAQAVELAIETQDVMYGSYHVVAGSRGFPIRLEADCSRNSAIARNTTGPKFPRTAVREDSQI